MRPLKSVLIHSVGWHLSELLDLIPTPIDHSDSVTGKVPERVTEKEKKISELLVEAPEAINGSPQVHTSYASHGLAFAFSALECLLAAPIKSAV